MIYVTLDADAYFFFYIVTFGTFEKNNLQIHIFILVKNNSGRLTKYFVFCQKPRNEGRYKSLLE